jgi:hypothetical protein
MDIKEICPCPNLNCPNYGFCDKCFSRHLRAGYLNFCAFYTVLPALKEAIDADPESLTAKKLLSMTENLLNAYAKLMEKVTFTGNTKSDDSKWRQITAIIYHNWYYLTSLTEGLV